MLGVWCVGWWVVCCFVVIFGMSCRIGDSCWLGFLGSGRFGVVFVGRLWF